MMNKIFSPFINSTKIVSNIQFRTYKVALLGASGGIGQPLGLFLKKTPLVTNLSLYDIKHAKGVAADLSHIERKGPVYGYDGPNELKPCLKNSDIVVITAGMPRKPGMSRNDLFQVNAKIVAELMVGIAQTCPTAIICVITNPINSIVPTCAAILEHFSYFDRNKLFGVTTLDIVRAITFISKAKMIDVNKLNVPIIGGHSETTLIPLLSQCSPPVQFPLEERNMIVDKIRNAGTEIVEAKAGQGSATLSMAWSGYRFINSLIDAMDGRGGVTEPSYVRSDDTECEFLSTPLILGKDGIEQNLGLGQMTEYEMTMLKSAIPEIKRDIVTGKQFATSFLKSLK